MLPTSKACGFVLTRPGPEGREYLLLVNRERGEPGLPKGHAEEGETELGTALRETEEETGLVDLDVDPWFRREIRYLAERRGVVHDKTVVYRLASARSGEVRLSREHSSHTWAPLAFALGALRHGNLREVLRDAALFLKDPALFRLERRTEAEADAHLASLPHADPRLVAHLRGTADIARRLAEALREAGVPVDPEATAAGAVLHDVGRAIGEHDDHQRAGLRHLRGTAFAPYAFACVSHFTKGADLAELVAAGVPSEVAEGFRREIDGATLTWEERCVALADSCMMGAEAVPPRRRFEDLRARYDAAALVDLQQRRTEELRRRMADRLGRDPLSVVGLTEGARS